MKARNQKGFLVVAKLTGIFMLLSFSLPASVASRVEPQPRQSARLDLKELETFLDPIFVEAMEKEHLPGAVFVLVKDGKVAMAKGYGYADVERKTAVRPEQTIFRIGSITKVFTALAVMQLADRRKIALDDDVNKYLDQPKVEEKYGEPIRFRHLLTHTAGFDQIGTGRRAPSPKERKTLGEFLNGQLLRVKPPGQVSCYDTYGITLAGHLVERISGLSYAEYMQRNIFSPLGMTRSAVEVADALKPDLARGYGYRNGQYVPQNYEYFITTPASSIDATALDMAQLMIAVLGDGSAGKGRFLSPATARQIKQPQFTNYKGFAGFAYGFWEDFRNGQRALWHGGSMLGYLSLMYLVPDSKLGFFVAYNRDEDAGGGPARLGETLKQKLMDKWFPGAREEQAKTALPIETERFAGSYADNMYCHTCPDGQGWGWGAFPVKSAGQGKLEMRGRRWLAVAPTIFQREDGPDRIAFLEDKQGQITHMVSDNRVYDRLGERLLDEVFGAGWRTRPAEPLVARVYRDSGEWKKAAAAYQSITARMPDNGRGYYYLGYCLLNAGEPDPALAALNRATELKQWPPDTSYLIAVAYALKKENDQALAWLDKAVTLGFANKDSLKNDARLSSIRDDPRFKALLEK